MRRGEKETKEDQEEVEEHWSLTRVVIVLIFLLLLGGAIFYFIQPFFVQKNTSVLGVKQKDIVQEQKTEQVLSKEEVNKMIEHAQKNLSKITSENIASYSSELQKVIENLKRLQSEKKAVDVVCDLLCKK